MANALNTHMAHKKVGMARTSERNWPSDRLHSISQHMEQGLDVRRLMALADVIEALPLARFNRGYGWMATRMVDGRTPVEGYELRGGGPDGLGSVHFEKGKAGALAYKLTGYGLVCWAWGQSMGMAAVADNGLVNMVHQVLTAEPVHAGVTKEDGLGLSGLTTKHVADAVRAFCALRSAKDAWLQVARECDPMRGTPVNGTPVPKVAPPAPKVVQVEESLSAHETWKQHLVKDEWAEAQALAEKKVADVEKRIDTLRSELTTWQKRAQAAELMVD